MSSTTRRSTKSSSANSAAAASGRRWIVLGSLAGLLMLTSALLLALAPAPLSPDASSSLFAVDAPDSMDAVFQTQTLAEPGRWKYIYIHHSNTPAGNALTLGQANGGVGDHFVIGNGDGCADGEIQLTQRWDRQRSALPPAGATALDPACISICLVGDFDTTMPTSTQLRRLAQVVGALQGRYRIPAKDILLVSGPDAPAAIGRHFPVAEFRRQLLP